MKTRLLLPILMAVAASGGLASAQDKSLGKQPPAKQSAPAEANEASGHDAQSGNPETADKSTEKRKREMKDSVPPK